MKRPNILLLTATVQPRTGQPSLAMTDPTLRLAEYEAALAFYAQLLACGAIDGIVFAENSGFDLAKLAARHPSERIEWLAIAPSEHPLHFHRGYAEFRLIDEAVERSTLIGQAAEGLRIWKISGRYIVRNLARVVRWAPEELDFYGAIARGWAEMSVLAWSRRGHRELVRGLWSQFATREAPELILYRHLASPSVGSLRIVRSFRWPPFIVGRRGTDGGAFQGPLTRYRHAFSLAGSLLTRPLLQWSRRFSHR
jgi:hypothetical protein